MFENIAVMADRGVAAAYKKWQDLTGELADLERRISETNNRLASLRDGKRRGPIERAAGRLMAGTTFKDIDGDVAGLRREYSKLYERRAVVARAAELQKKTLGKEKARASREICERIEPEYRAIVAGLAKSMIAVGKAMMADITFFETLRDGDVMHSSLRGMNVAALGDPRDRHGRLAMWLQEAIAFGVIDEATVPAEWRERWNR